MCTVDCGSGGRLEEEEENCVRRSAHALGGVEQLLQKNTDAQSGASMASRTVWVVYYNMAWAEYHGVITALVL